MTNDEGQKVEGEVRAQVIHKGCVPLISVILSGASPRVQSKDLASGVPV